jgi:hypoxanthine phosphoribosyltransferase
MVIHSPSFDKLPDKYMLGFYYPADFEYYDDGKYPENEEFNGYSEMIIDLKDHHDEAISHFYDNLSKIFSNLKDVSITTPPTSSGIEQLAQMLSAYNDNITDLTGCFGRHNKRDIYLNKNYSITDRKIILIDDVVTSGETMRLCQSELIKAGAKQVKCITLGRTWRGMQEAYEKIELSFEYNLKKEQENLYKKFINVGYKFHESADTLIKLQPYTQDIFFKTLEWTTQEIDKIRLLIQEIEWSVQANAIDLHHCRDEAIEVICGEDIFSYLNTLQQPFLW